MAQQCPLTIDLFERDMNKVVGPDPEPLGGASGSGAVAPCSYLKIMPHHRADSAAQASTPSTQNSPGINGRNLPFDRYDSDRDRISKIAEAERRRLCSAKHLSEILGEIVHVYSIDRKLTFYNLHMGAKP